MRFRPSFALILICSLVLTGCYGNRFTASSGWSGPVAEGDQVYIGSRDGRVLALEAASGRRRASFPPSQQDPLGGLYGTPALADGLLFVGDYSGRLYALKAADISIEEWHYPKDDSRLGRIVGGVTVAEGMVVFGSSDGYVRALRTVDGSLEWEFKTGDMVWSTPTIVNGIVYVGSLDHHVYALSLRDGQQRWTKPFEAGGGIVSSPLVADGKVFVGSFDRSFYVLDSTNGVEIQRFGGDSWFWSSPITDGSRVYAATTSGKLYALDVRIGLQWRELIDLESRILSTPVIVRGNIVVTSDGGVVHVLSPETGQKLSPGYNVGAEVRAPLTADGDIVYVNAMDRQVWAIRVAGAQEEIWHITTNSET